jgi:hypothetical protein
MHGRIAIVFTIAACLMPLSVAAGEIPHAPETEATQPPGPGAEPPAPGAVPDVPIAPADTQAHPKEEALPATPPAAIPGDPEALQKVAPSPIGPELLDERDLTIAVQSELQRLGCEPGNLEGAWDEQSRLALAEFGQHRGIDPLELSPSPELVETLKRETGTVCTP